MSLSFNLFHPRRDFNLELQGKFENTATGIFGSSGAGKTSFFNLLVGLEKPERGKICLNDRILTDTKKKIFITPNKRRIGLVFQEKRLFPHLNVRQNIVFGEKYVEEKRISFDTVVELLELGSFLESMPSEISGGEQQRTAIARTLMTSPELLLMDEPFNAVDNSLRSAIFPYLKRLLSEFEIPMLVISHNLPDIQRLTNKIYLIEKGKCAGFGSIMDLLGKRELSPDETRVVNTFNVSNPKKLDDSLYVYRIRGTDKNTIRAPFRLGKEAALTIAPDEIAISRELITNTTIQNHLQGEITDLINKNGYVYCLVDAGVPILCKITEDSRRRLNLSKGERVYCFFKAHALYR